MLFVAICDVHEGFYLILTINFIVIFTSFSFEKNN